MANKEIVNVITIKTEQSQNTIKGLRTEISNLKKDLENAEIGSEKFEQASRDLAKAQADLKTVLTDGKKATDAVDGSYNHLVATMAELKKQWKATADEVKRNELGQQIDNINTQLKDLDATIGNNQRLVGSYAEEFKKALAEQDDATIGTRAKLEGLQKVTAGLASGYAAIQGATALLGIENENLEQTFVKVQAAMAIASGVGGMKDLIEGAGRLKVAFKGATSGVKAFIGGLKGVKGAIAATGIGIFIVLLGELIAHWEEITDLFSASDEKIADNTEALNDLEEAMKVKDDEDNFIVRMAEAAGKSKEEIIALQKELLKTRNIELGDALIRSQLEYDDAKKEDEKWYNFGSGKRLKAAEENLNKARELYNENQKAIKKLDEDLAVYQKTQETKRNQESIEAAKRAAAEKAEANKAAADKAAADAAEAERQRIENAKKAEEKRISNQEHNIGRWAELEKRKLDQQQKARNEWAAENEVGLDGNSDGWYTPEELNQYQQFLDAKQAMYAESIMAENMLIQSQIEKLQELADAQAAAGMDSTGTLESIEDLKLQLEDNNAAILDNERKTLKAKEKANQQYVQEQEKQEKMLADYKLGMASDVLGSLSSLLGEQTAAGKAAAVAQATIDTYMAANSAYSAMAGIPVVGPALGAAAAAAAIIAGIVNVKKILSVSPDGSNASSVVGGGAAATPNVNLADSMPITYTRELLLDRGM